MSKALDSQQEKVLSFFREHSGEPRTLREVGFYVQNSGLHPQKVSNKIQQLEKLGYLRKNFDTDSYDVIEEPIEDIVYFNLYGYAQCGNHGSNIVDERPVGTIGFSTVTLGVKDPENYFFVKAKGNSMEPKIHNEDLVLVRKQSDYEVGTSVLVVHNEDLKIKKIYQDGGKKILMSDNPTVGNLEIQPYDELKVVGIVKKVIRDIA